MLNFLNYAKFFIQMELHSSKQRGNSMLKVSEVMTKDVKYLSLTNTLQDLINLFATTNLSSVVIVSEPLKPHQILTIRDIFKIIGLDPKDYNLEEILNKLNKNRENLITVEANKNIKFALDLMQKHNISHLPVVNKKGELVGILSIRDLVNYFSLLTFTDGLTGVYNRKYLDVIIPKLINNRNICILMIDIDNFKNINDTYGHSFGDVVLKKTAQVIRKSLRLTDEIIRYGGEEFLVILFRCFAEKIFEVAERIRNNVQKISFKEYPQVTITVSIGGYNYQPGENFYSAIEKADKALYKAKASGKNCTVIYIE